MMHFYSNADLLLFYRFGSKIVEQNGERDMQLKLRQQKDAQIPQILRYTLTINTKQHQTKQTIATAPCIRASRLSIILATTVICQFDFDINLFYIFSYFFYLFLVLLTLPPLP